MAVTPKKRQTLEFAGDILAHHKHTTSKKKKFTTADHDLPKLELLGFEIALSNSRFKGFGKISKTCFNFFYGNMLVTITLFISKRPVGIFARVYG